MSKSTKKHPKKNIAHHPVLRREVDNDGTEMIDVAREQFKIPATFVQTFDNILEVAAKVDHVSLLLIFYMDEDSCIYLNIHEKTRFLEELQEQADKQARVREKYLKSGVGKEFRKSLLPK